MSGRRSNTDVYSGFQKALIRAVRGVEVMCEGLVIDYKVANKQQIRPASFQHSFLHKKQLIARCPKEKHYDRCASACLVTA